MVYRYQLHFYMNLQTFQLQNIFNSKRFAFFVKIVYEWCDKCTLRTLSGVEKETWQLKSNFENDRLLMLKSGRWCACNVSTKKKCYFGIVHLPQKLTLLQIAKWLGKQHSVVSKWKNKMKQGVGSYSK